jgi:hypothetical protein
LQSGVEQNLLKTVAVADGVAGGEEAFVGDSDLVSVLVFEQAQTNSAKQAEVGGGVPFAESRLIF